MKAPRFIPSFRALRTPGRAKAKRSLDPQPDGPKAILERLTHGGVIIDNEYHTGRVRHADLCSPIWQCEVKGGAAGPRSWWPSRPVVGLDDRERPDLRGRPHARPLGLLWNRVPRTVGLRCAVSIPGHGVLHRDDDMPHVMCLFFLSSMTSRRGPSPAPPMASTAFMMILSRTCCSWMRSPGDWPQHRRGAQRVPTSSPGAPQASGRPQVKASTSRMVFDSCPSNPFSCGGAFPDERPDSRLMILPLARCPSLDISC